MTKTGTASIAEAYRILGYKDVHHGFQCIIETPGDFDVFSRAADSTFPNLPTYTGVPFTRAEWYEAFGSCEAVTLIASFFAPSLIEVYPDARVVLVERDVEIWYKSMDANLLMT
jgi:Sulfotransferase domain